MREAHCSTWASASNDLLCTRTPWWKRDKDTGARVPEEALVLCLATEALLQ